MRLEHDATTDGQPVWMAFDDSLPGCMAQGFTEDEARDELALARHEYLRSLWEDGLLAESKSIGADVNYEDVA